ncbi:MAG: terpene cyclase/mutase family protein [Planctomycetes bacterium]|nr:terpene cyclase/mutase family protein [Planctomycetota bacterium]
MPEKIIIQTKEFEQETFQDAIREMFKKAPWFAVSIAIHAILALIVMNIDWRTEMEGQDKIIQGVLEDEKLEPLPEEVPEEEEKKMEEREEIIEDPTVSDEMLVEEEFLDDENPIDDMDNKNVNDVIGVGGGAGSKFGGKYRKRAVKKGGQATQKAVELGLEWLAKHQDPEGFWDCDGFHYQDDPNMPRSTGPGTALNDVGVTGLALLAFLGSGNTPNSGPYKANVRDGVRYLCDIQNPEDGCIPMKEGEQYMYNHAIGTLALTEAYGLSGWAPLKKFAKKALQYIHDTKNPGMAWRYNNGDPDPVNQNDISVTGWMIMCLASAKDFGLPYEKHDVIDSLGYIEMMTDNQTGRTGYKQRGSLSSREPGDQEIWPAQFGESMTAVAMLCRVWCGSILDNLDTQEEWIAKGAKLLDERPPRWGEVDGKLYTDYYYWYYGSYAMFQMGGKHWNDWKDKMIDAVVENQITEAGNEQGSWDPQVDPWGDSGGRVYSTALCVLCLEVFYRYDNVLGSR